jgi:predicted type IV restriction endonuclease
MSDLLARDANEGDTRLLVTDFLCEALGFDKYENLTTEYAVKTEFADYGVRIEKQLVAFIEVKRTATKLSDRHLRQVEMYAVNEGVEWMILTNGINWQTYHLSPGMPVQIDLALDVDLLSSAATLNQKAALLFYLTIESLKRRQIDDVWKAKRAESPKSLAEVICSTPVLEAIRRELKKSTGHSVEADTLRDLIRETVLQHDLI